MKKREDGFTLVELLVAMVMFVMVISAASQVFTSLLTQFKQQSKIVETQVEGLLGLEILRYDIEHAGFGLPWRMGGAAYLEAGFPGEGKTSYVDRNFNDGPPDNCTHGSDAAGASNPPGAIRSANEVELIAGCTGGSSTFNDSDVLVVKSTNVTQYNNRASQKWTHLAVGDSKRNGLSGDDFEDTDRVTVIAPGNNETTRRTLVVAGGNFSTTYNGTSGYAPIDSSINLVYGIKEVGDPILEPRMPFNRADYYIHAPSPPPARCAPGTGTLYKGELGHEEGYIPVELPLLDCVADMQVVYVLSDGSFADASYTYDLTAAEIRDQVKVVGVYILAHEGQKGATYTFNNYNCGAPGDPCITVGPDTGEGRDFDFNAAYAGAITDHENYRWKVYTLLVTPENMRVLP
jgi:prepilin-type N-terminal cleavage/methylation domain-containing protein